jgi:hypothetical protein
MKSSSRISIDRGDVKSKKDKRRDDLSSSSSYTNSFSSSYSLSEDDGESTAAQSKRKSPLGGILRRSSSSLSLKNSKTKLKENEKHGDKKKSPSSSRSGSSESLVSNRSNLSRAQSLRNLEIEYEPNIGKNLPLNVYQTLFSIKSSNICVYAFKKEYQVSGNLSGDLIRVEIFVTKVLNSKQNLEKIKSAKSSHDSIALKAENERLVESMINELVGSIALIQVIYGSFHWKLAKEHTNLALIYLEHKNLPKQAKVHCEKAWSILVEDLKHKSIHVKENELADESEKQPKESVDDEFTEEEAAISHAQYQGFHRHQMMLNYIYGRASTLLKEYQAFFFVVVVKFTFF